MISPSVSTDRPDGSVLTAAAGLATEVDRELVGNSLVDRRQTVLEFRLGIEILFHHWQVVESTLGVLDLAHRLTVRTASLPIQHELVAELFELPDHLLGFGIVFDGLVSLDVRFVFGTVGDLLAQLASQIFECCGLNAHTQIRGSKGLDVPEHRMEADGRGRLTDRSHRITVARPSTAGSAIPAETTVFSTHGQPYASVSVLWLVALTIGSTAIVWAGSRLLDTASQRLALYYGLPAVVQGAVIVAIGSSFPELASVVLAVLIHGTFDLGVGTIVGSAIFNILVIPAVAALSRSPLSVNRAVVYKEAQFYMLSIAVLLLTFSFGVIYNTDGSGTVSEISRPLAAIPLAIYGLYLFIQYQDISDYEAPISPETIAIGREWLRLLGGLVLIVIAVEGLIHAALGFGELFDSPEFIWGLIIVAAGTSLPDAIMSVRAAKRDQGEVSLANVLGSNTFDLLVALPVGVMLVGVATVDYALAVPMMGVLTLATIILFTLMRTDLQINRWEAWVLAGSYGLFVAWIAIETLGLINTLPGV